MAAFMNLLCILQYNQNNVVNTGLHYFWGSYLLTQFQAFVLYWSVIIYFHLLKKQTLGKVNIFIHKSQTFIFSSFIRQSV